MHHWSKEEAGNANGNTLSKHWKSGIKDEPLAHLYMIPGRHCKNCTNRTSATLGPKDKIRALLELHFSHYESRLTSEKLSEREFETDMAFQWSFECSIIDLLIHGAEVH
jgi:hypothetical protein